VPVPTLIEAAVCLVRVVEVQIPVALGAALLIEDDTRALELVPITVEVLIKFLLGRVWIKVTDVQGA